MNVYENIVLPAKLMKRKVDEKEVFRLVKDLEIQEKLFQMPDALSGGQQQRVAIARALASQAPIILADEPTGNLDEDTAAEITEILKDNAHRLNRCVVVVTHSEAVAKEADEVFRLSHGKVIKE